VVTEKTARLFLAPQCPPEACLTISTINGAPGSARYRNLRSPTSVYALLRIMVRFRTGRLVSGLDALSSEQTDQGPIPIEFSDLCKTLHKICRRPSNSGA
jgi:hypothetical protein